MRHSYLNPVLFPLTDASTFPFWLKQGALDWVVVRVKSFPGSIVTVLLLEQLFLSETSTVYTPGPKLLTCVMIEIVVLEASLQVTLKGPFSDCIITCTTASFLPTQDTGCFIIVVISNAPCGFNWTLNGVAVQLLASVTETV